MDGNLDGELERIRGWLREQVKASGHTQTGVALACGVSHETVWRWLHHSLTLKGFLMVCYALSISPSRAFEDARS